MSCFLSPAAILLYLLAPVVLAGCLLLGPRGFGLPDTATPIGQALLELRLYRIAAGFVVGAGLACSGAVLQALLRNPLADPYVLGVSGGGALGAALAIFFGWSALHALALPAGAFAVALATLLLVYRLASRHGVVSVYGLILSGVVVSSMLSSFLRRVIQDETGLSEERVTAALLYLLTPDADSRTPGENGRRIVPLDEHRTWGWRITNHMKYRELCTKSQNAERQARFRDKHNSNAPVTPSVTPPVGVGVTVTGIHAVGIEGGCKGGAKKLGIKGYDDADFTRFWNEYPRREGKKDAFRAWNKALDRPEIGKIVAAVQRAISSEQWTKNNGQYIPHPATWLNRGSWYDELRIPQGRQDAVKYTSESDPLLGGMIGPDGKPA